MQTDVIEEKVDQKNTAKKSANKNSTKDLEGVTITHGERIIDKQSGSNKLALAKYYAWIAPKLLPYLADRPVYLLRAPDGIGGEVFFQKHNTRLTIPHIKLLSRKLDPGHDSMLVIDSASALVGAAQMGTIELHTCNARSDKFEQPDCMVFDLDPGEGLSWQAVVDAAHLTKAVLDEIGLISFIKTSGGKGLHIVVPLTRTNDWETVSDFSRAVAQHMARLLPDRFSAKMGASNRVGKVFVDYLRNSRHASTACAYSARARPGLAVSVPISWQELPALTGAAQWNIHNLAERLEHLKADPWQDYFKTKQKLTKAMREKFRV